MKKPLMKRLKSVDEFPIFDCPPLNRQKQKATQNIKNVKLDTIDETIGTGFSKNKAADKLMDNRGEVYEQNSITNHFDFYDHNTTALMHDKKQEKSKTKIVNKNQKETNESFLLSPFDKLYFSPPKQYDGSYIHLHSNDINGGCNKSQETSCRSYLCRDINKQKHLIDASAQNKLSIASTLKLNVDKSNICSIEVCEFHNTDVNSSHKINEHHRKIDENKDNTFNSVRISTPNNPDFVFCESYFNNMGKNKLNSIETSYFIKKQPNTYNHRLTENNLNVSNVHGLYSFTELCKKLNKPEINSDKQKKRDKNLSLSEVISKSIECKETNTEMCKSQESILCVEPEKCINNIKKDKRRNNPFESKEHKKVDTQIHAYDLKYNMPFTELESSVNKYKEKNKRKNNLSESNKFELKEHHHIQTLNLERYALSNTPETSYHDKQKQKHTNSQSSVAKTSVLDYVEDSTYGDKRKFSIQDSLGSSIIFDGCKQKKKYKKNKDKNIIVNDANNSSNYFENILIANIEKHIKDIKVNSNLSDLNKYDYEIKSGIQTCNKHPINDDFKNYKINFNGDHVEKKELGNKKKKKHKKEKVYLSNDEDANKHPIKDIYENFKIYFNDKHEEELVSKKKKKHKKEKRYLNIDKVHESKNLEYEFGERENSRENMFVHNGNDECSTHSKKDKNGKAISVTCDLLNDYSTVNKLNICTKNSEVSDFSVANNMFRNFRSNFNEEHAGKKELIRKKKKKCKKDKRYDLNFEIHENENLEDKSSKSSNNRDPQFTLNVNNECTLDKKRKNDENEIINYDSPNDNAFSDISQLSASNKDMYSNSTTTNDTFKNCKINPCLNSYDLAENSNDKQKEQKIENNLNLEVQTSVNQPEIFSKKHKKKKKHSNSFQLEENSSDKPIEQKLENNLNVEPRASFNEFEKFPKKHKKKKKHSNSLQLEKNSRDKPIEQKIENNLNVEIRTSFNKPEIFPKKHKKKKKHSNFLQLEENSSDKQIEQTKEYIFDVPEIFPTKQKKKKKHLNYHELEENYVDKQMKEIKENNLDIDEVCTINILEMLRKHEKIQRHLNSYDLAENFNNKQKEQRIENNLNLEAQTSFNEPEIFSKKHKKKKKHSNSLQFEEKSSDKPIEQKIENNFNAEIRTSFNEPEIFPKKHKKKKKQSNFLQLEENSSNKQIEQSKECIFDVPEIFPTKQKKKKKHLNLNYHELEENSVDKQMEEISENNLNIDKVCTIFDKTEMPKKQKKSKHLRRSNLEEILNDKQTIDKNLDIKTCTSSNKTEIFRKKHKKQKRNSVKEKCVENKFKMKHRDKIKNNLVINEMDEKINSDYKLTKNNLITDDINECVTNKKHKKNKNLKCNLHNDYSDISESNPLNEDIDHQLDSTVANNAFENSRINVNDKNVGKKQSISKKKDKGKKLFMDEVYNNTCKNIKSFKLSSNKNNNYMSKCKKSYSENVTIVPHNKIYDLLHDSNTNRAHDFVDSSNFKKDFAGEENSETSSDEGVLDPEALHCEEDPVNFDVPPLHKFEKVCRLSKKEKNTLLSAGVIIKGGKYTTAEDNIIKRNFEDFTKRYDILSDSVKLLGIGRYKKDLNLLKFLRAKHFYVRLGKDLNDRELFSIYRRARNILDPFRNAGKFTRKEIAKIKKLHKSETKWYKMGNILGKTAASCVQVIKWHEKDIAKGKFTVVEKKQLVKAIKKITGNSDLSCKNMKGVNWETIASYVPTRNNTQCRYYWANYLAWKIGSARKKWNHDCYCKLVHILREMNVENSSMIDWFKIYESFEDFAPSDIFVQKCWLYLRSRIPDYKNKSHKEIIELLCKKYPLSQEMNDED